MFISLAFQTTKARQYLEKAAKAGHKGAPGTLGKIYVILSF